MQTFVVEEMRCMHLQIVAAHESVPPQVRRGDGGHVDADPLCLFSMTLVGVVDVSSGVDVVITTKRLVQRHGVRVVSLGDTEKSRDAS